jgi:adenine-specific DNA-methyltransferase
MKLDYKIYTGDRIEFLNKVKNNSVQLIITSPPYNIGKSYERKEPLEKYLDEQKKTLIECVKKLKDEGSLCWQVGNFIKAKSEIIPLDIMIYNICKDLGFKLRNRIIWHFEHGLHSNKKFSGRYETILWFTKSNDYYFDFNDIRVPQKYPGKLGYKGKNKGKYTGHKKGKNPSDVWIFPNVKSNHREKTLHPCQFPIELAERLVLSMSKKNDLVIDPYAGVGTTLLAAVKNNRISKGSEIIQKYINIANERFKLFVDGKLPYRDRNQEIKIVKGNSKLYFRND